MSLDRPCGGCGATRARLVLAGVRQPERGVAFDLVRCVGCGLVRTRAEGDAADPYFDAGYHRDRQGATGALAARARVALVRRHTARGAWLDVGCGDGAVLRAAATLGFRVVGVERGLGLARAASMSPLPLWDTIAAARAAGPFDVVTFFHSLQSFAQPRAALVDAHRALAPGGLLVVAVPAFDALQADLFGRHWASLDVPRHLSHFDATSLDDLLARTGFRPIEVRRGDARYDVFGWLQSALDLASGRPHALFRALGGDRTAPRGVVAAHATAAALLGPIAVGLTAATMVFGGAATLTVCARAAARAPLP